MRSVHHGHYFISHGDHFYPGSQSIQGDKMMKNILRTLLPAKADNTIRGMKLPAYVFTLIAIISISHYFLHPLLSPPTDASP
jgi:hypothetical protein